MGTIVNFLLRVEDYEVKDYACKYDIMRHSNADPNLTGFESYQEGSTF